MLDTLNETKTLSSGSAFFKRIDNQGTYAILPKGLTFEVLHYNYLILKVRS